MTHDSARVRRLAATLYGYAFLVDLVLLYPVYALLFSDTGLSVGQISSLFVIWSAASTLLEVPSGAWADAVSRRLLLGLAPLVTAAGFALWVLVPSYPAFAVGFLLWGAGGALASGALEALVYTELGHLGATARYARTMGRARTAGTVGVLLSTALAAPVLAFGGYPAVGAASVLACLLAAVVATRLPEHPSATPPITAAGPVPAGPVPAGPVPAGPLPAGPVPAGPVPAGPVPAGPVPAGPVPAGPLPAGPVPAGPVPAGPVPAGPVPAGPVPAGPVPAGPVPAGPLPAGPDLAGSDLAGPDEGGGEDDLGWWASLRAGLAEVRADRAVRSAVLLLAVVTAVWGALEEYTPLLAADTGVARETVPLLLLLLSVGQTAGGLLAPLGERLTDRGYALLPAASGLALAAGALIAHPAGFVLLAVSFGGFQLATVLADARLQDRITGTGRATVTSLAGTATDVGTIAVYGAYGLLATGAGNGVAFAVLAVPYLIVALALVVRRTARSPVATRGRMGS